MNKNLKYGLPIQTIANDIMHTSIWVVFTVLFFSVAVSRIILVTKVEGHSMEPTLHDGQYIVACRLADIQRGDVVLYDPLGTQFEKINGISDYIVKRVIATSGDSVKIWAGDVYVNDSFLCEKYCIGLSGYMPEITVPEGQVFLMGDNREHSTDSRAVGTVRTQNIVGKVAI